MRSGIGHFLNKNDFSEVYQFGVFNGDSMGKLLRVFRDAGRPITKMYGFDSFEGFPETDENYQDCWVKGGLNATEHMGCSSIDECMLTILEKLRPDQGDAQITLVPGYFSDSLTDERAAGMGPAALIDIDVDLYSSAVEVLEFVIKNGILASGTLVWYDDWGGSPRWQENADGESLAHKEACEKYGVEMEMLFQVGTTFPHVQRLYVVK